MLRKIGPYLPYILVIVALIVAIILVVSFRDDKKSTKKDEATKTSHNQGKAKDKTAGSSTKASQPEYTVRTSPAPTPTQSANATQNHGTTELAESGPTETAALFFVTVVLAYAGHSYYLRSKI